MSTENNAKEQKFIKVYKVYVDEIYQFIYTRSGFDIPITEDIVALTINYNYGV